MGELTFDGNLHEYRLDGAKIPSVTTIIRDMGLIDTQFFTEAGRDRGVTAHRLTELFDLGTLDPESVDPRLRGYLEGWIEFTKKEGFIWTDIEKRMHHPALGYAGAFDRLGINRSGRRVVVDIKTGPPAGWHKWQLAAYALMSDGGSVISTIHRVGVHLKEDGQFRVETYTDIQDYADWLAILRVFKLSKKGEK